VRRTYLLIAVACLAPTGCAVGPRALLNEHRRYNDAFVRADSEELLLNIVRLRYNDPPAEVEITAFAEQHERAAQAEARPFFST
jgi:hypothetical protein